MGVTLRATGAGGGGGGGLAKPWGLRREGETGFQHSHCALAFEGGGDHSTGHRHCSPMVPVILRHELPMVPATLRHLSPSHPKLSRREAVPLPGRVHGGGAYP